MGENQDIFSKHSANEIHKKKVRIHENFCSEPAKIDPSLKAELLRNRCLYCHKVFFNSKFLLKHVMRRHSDNLISLHKKLISNESDVISNDIQQVIAFLGEEFLIIKNELSQLKYAVGRNNNSVSSDETSSFKMKSVSKEKTADYDFQSNDFKILESKVKHVENNLQTLSSKLSDLDIGMRTEVLLKKDFGDVIAFNEEKILKAQETQFIKLREDLCRHLEEMLLLHLNDIDSNWKIRFSELNKEVKQLDRLIETVKKQVDSPDNLKNMEKKLEHHIRNFLGNSRQRYNKSRTPKGRSKISASRTHNRHSVNISKSSSNTNKLVNTSHAKELDEPSVTVDDLSFLLNEKFAELSIAPDKSKMSNADFVKKLHIIETEKEHLKKLNPTFSDDYKKLCLQVDQKFQNQIERRKNRKIRFTDPLYSSSRVLPGSEADIDICVPEISPYLSSHKFDENEIKHDLTFPKRRFSEVKQCNFSDINAGGDNRDVSRKFHSADSSQLNHVKKLQTSTPIPKAQKSKVTAAFSENCSVIKSVPSSSRKVLDYTEWSVHKKNEYVTEEHPAENGVLFVEPIAVNGNEYNDDDFDANSVESLSSWEEENTLDNSVNLTH